MERQSAIKPTIIMKYEKTNWRTEAYGNAMLKAIQENRNPRYFRQQGDKVLFNGFWRDGNKQNCCLWPDQGTFADAKTGQGGGKKD